MQRRCSRTSRRTRSARTRDRAGARVPRLLRPASAAGAPRSDRHVLRAERRGCARPARGGLRDVARGYLASGGSRSGALARPGHRRGGAGRVHRPGDRNADRRLRDRQPRQGRRRPGGAEREPRARPARDRRAPARGGARVSVTAAQGFVASGVAAGIRRKGLDLAVVRSTVPAVGAAMWTVNQVLAAPVVVSKEHLAVAEPQAIVINSGVANAATGERGELDALATTAEAGRLLDLHAEEVLVLSTGVIGALLPLEKVLGGLREAVPALSPAAGPDAAEAILTTDTRTKEASLSLDG